MTLTTQTITLSSNSHYGRKIPSQALGPALTAIPVVVRQSVSMAFRGRSGGRGPHPSWLKAASDLRFINHEGDDDTRLIFEVPTLGESAVELYRQQELWPTRPDPALTAIDLLGAVVADVSARNEDSDRFDGKLLSSLAKFGSVLNGEFRSMLIEPSRAGLSAAVINPEVVTTAHQFHETTPLPQRVRITGILDMVRASTQSFGLRLDNDEDVRGVLTTGSVVDAASHLSGRVLVLGRAIYRASGRLLRIDADEISVATDESSFWSSIPKPRARRLDLRRVVREQSHKKGIEAILGQWPGDETDEQIEQALREIG